ncbi:MAG: phosphoribosylformylglycinamidine synthase subunit PurQ [Chloroflexota bacterium]|nr:phosphoribosylformylglycinamidine synthase subunit PurQ [Chloroflexota bacterium]
MTFGVVVFPGSNCDADTEHALSAVLGARVVELWHGDETVKGVDCVVVPGGFAYGDYLRAGAIARFSPVMRAVARHAAAGGLVLGICNGFQVLVEAHLLPGALLRNDILEFRCRTVGLRVERADTPFTNRYAVGEIIGMPIAHGEGRYYADAATLDRLEANEQVVLRYAPLSGDPAGEDYNPNGSLRDIAGIVNERGNVCGLMPHPERCCDALVGGEDGRRLFESVIASLVPA